MYIDTNIYIYNMYIDTNIYIDTPVYIYVYRYKYIYIYVCTTIFDKIEQV